MDIKILGPLEVDIGGTTVALGPKQLTLLAVLLVQRGSVVSTDRIVADLYGRDPPRNAAKTLQVHVSRLRKTLGDGALLTSAGGYRLGLAGESLDAERFERLADAGRGALGDGDPREASRLLHEALALWRGPPLQDFAYADFAQAEIARLEELRLSALEDRVAADLESGRHATVVAELDALVKTHPHRERLRAYHMVALYRTGRQADALDAFQRARTQLVEELGIEPGRELRELERAILQQDAALDLAVDTQSPQNAASVSPRPPDPELSAKSDRESRKTVTALTAAISGIPTTGSSLDPEALRRITSIVFTEVSDAVARHGGNVESVSAEAMNAVFGVPEVHEDDALRAIRAAGDIQTRLARVEREHLSQRSIDLAVQIGISTGEVVVGGDSSVGLLVTGAPFIKAERLAQLADTGSALLDDATVRLAGQLVTGNYTTIGERSVFRLDRLLEMVPPRFRAPMLGRDREQRRLLDAYEQAVADQSCQLFTILGAAGVGKSRLAQEFLESLDGVALVARGRCLPYGEGITFWPVLEAVKDLVDVDVAAPEAARTRIAGLLEDTAGADEIATQIADLIGLGETRVSAEERVTAMQRFVEGLGHQRPFVLVFDDIHWGEETFLDLVEHLADWCRDTTVLLLCMARPELLDVRPGWAGGKLNATSVLLEPLSARDSDELVEHLLGGAELSSDVKERITQAAEGNPLFVEEMVAMLVDDGLLVREGGRWAATADLTAVPVPPTISGLIVARLDRLPHAERAAIERASVEGKVFHRSSVEALSSEDGKTSVSDALGGLLRKELIRPDRPVFAGEDGYRFRHLLIRDAAYDSIPKQLRAELHERHAAWLQERIGAGAVDYTEIVGYHLEQAYRFREELGMLDEATRTLGRQAAELLGAAGRRAFLRSDGPAGANLLARAVALLPPEDPLRVDLVPNVRVVQGLADLGWADRVLTEAIEASATTGDRALAAHALVQRGLLRLFDDPNVTARELLDVSERAVKVFAEIHDELGLARAWRLAAQAHYLDRHAAGCAEASEEALRHVQRARDPFEEQEIVEWLVIALVLGPAPARAAIARCEALLAHAGDDSLLRAEILAVTAPLLAMQGLWEESDAAFLRAREIMTDRDEWIWIATFWHSFVHVWRGTPELGEAELRTAYESLKAMGEKSHFSSIAHALASVVLAQGRYDEAQLLTEECEAASRANDVHSQIAWRSIRAHILAHRGDLDEAERLARDAIDFGASSDFLIARAEAYDALAEVLGLDDRAPEARQALEAALGLYEQKGHLLATKTMGARIARLATSS